MLAADATSDFGSTSLVLATLGFETGAQLDCVREIWESVEGKAAQRIEISEPEQPASKEDLKDHIRNATRWLAGL